MQVSAVVLFFKTDFVSEFIYSSSVSMFYLCFFLFRFPPLHGRSVI